MTTFTTTRRSVLAGLAGGAATLALGRPALAQKAPIRIGIMQTLGGALGVIGTAHLNGAQLAVDQINAAGGIGGNQVELVVRDNKLSADAAVAHLREFAGMGINIVIGDGFSSVNLATVPLLEELGLVMTSPSTVLMRFTHEDFTPNFFRSGPNAFMQFGGQTRILARDYPKVLRWGAIQLDNAGFAESYQMSAKTMVKNYKEIAGADVELVEPVLAKVGSTDFRTQINQLMSQGLDGLIVALAGADAVTFLRQAKPFGLLDSLKAVCDQNLNVNAGPLLKQDLPKGFLTPTYWYPTPYADLPLVQDYQKRWKEKTGADQIDPFSTNTHTGMSGLAAAIAKAGSTGTAEVIKALEGTEFASLHGPIRFRAEDHQLMIPSGYLEVVPAKSEAGYENARYIVVPAADAIEPPAPGQAFQL